MTTLEIHFPLSPDSKKTPYIRNEDSVEYTCDGKEGSLCFDGYYYVEDHAPPYPEDDAMNPWDRPNRYTDYLPQTVNLYMKRRETEPYKEEVDERGWKTYHYNIIEEHMYVVEIYKRIIHESTNKYSQVEDDDEMMNVCFFPTNKQTLYFRVLQTL